MDWWAIGVILYEFIVGIPPFNDDSIDQIWKNITSAKIEWPEIGYDEGCMSPEAKDLIRKLLEPDPQKRIKSLKEFKRHSFFNGMDTSNTASLEAPCLPSFNFWKLMKLEGKSFDEIFEDKHNLDSGQYSANDIDKSELIMVRNDLLHEQNLQKLGTSA